MQKNEDLSIFIKHYLDKNLDSQLSIGKNFLVKVWPYILVPYFRRIFVQTNLFSWPLEMNRSSAEDVGFFLKPLLAIHQHPVPVWSRMKLFVLTHLYKITATLLPHFDASNKTAINLSCFNYISNNFFLEKIMKIKIHSWKFIHQKIPFYSRQGWL